MLRFIISKLFGTINLDISFSFHKIHYASKYETPVKFNLYYKNSVLITKMSVKKLFML